jgi:VWA domain-containing protein
MRIQFPQALFSIEARSTMFKRASLEHNLLSTCLSRCSRLSRFLRPAWAPVLALLLCGFALDQSLSAQSADARGLESYSNAIKQSVIAARIQSMEQFLQLAPDSRLREDGLEFLAWDYLRTGNRAQSAKLAQELARVDASNPLAIAIAADAGADAQEPANIRLTKNKEALDKVGAMRKPEGMADNEFRLLKMQVETMLLGAAGLTSLELRDYAAARSYLIQAVTGAPDNGRFAYGLGLALLLDKNPDASKGYWYLARAVNLTRGTQAGDQISTFARERYQQDGGNDGDWTRFLAATAPSQRSGANAVNPAAAVSMAGRNGTTAQHSGITKTQSSATKIPVKVEDQTLATASVPAPASVRATAPSASVAANAPIEKTDWPRSTTKSAQSGLKPVPQNAPVSLGILVQTGLLTGRNRQEIIDTLRDITRNLRPDDEVFIMAFSNQLDFEQDLTGNSALLEEALSELKPSSGAALFDGIMFAAGHLNRIGKNQNRALLVISDGRDTTNRENTAPLTAQLRNVRIDCIGLDVSGSGERDLLERLASYSGGKASFASDPGQFRAAAGAIAQTIGIDFQQ